jgi:outer membrane protein TolC
MRTKGLWRFWTGVALLGTLGAGVAHSDPLTAEGAVKIALVKSTEVIDAEASIVSARGGVLGSYGSLLPSLSVGLSRNDSRVDKSFGPSFINGQLVGGGPTTDSRTNSSGTFVSVPNIGILNLSSWVGLSAARQGLKASQLQRSATRNDVALATRRQFYSVVQAIKLADVATGALKRARDDERRVNAMFQVGSVSKSDLLKARVATAQSELDSISARHAIVVSRVALAAQMGVRESDLGEVDTLLVASPQAYDEAALVAEAAKNRPDLIAALASLKSAKASHTAARIGRLPYVTAGGSASFNSRSFTSARTAGTPFIDAPASGNDLRLSGQIALNWDVFDLAGIDARIASTRANEIRAQATYDALQRNLASEVHEQLLAYNEAVEQRNVAERGLESAVENLKLTQEKYNVGSATILELIDAQVQLQTAQSNEVKALAAIRVAEAQVNRVRGHGE